MQLGLKLFGSLLAFSTLFQLSHAITRDDQLKNLFEFRDRQVNKSKNWVTALESWTCPTAAGKSDQSCDPCGMKYLGNWRHMHCRGYSNGTGEGSRGLYDGFVSNVHITDVRIDGPIPRELCMFSHIREFDVDGGHLTGPIPEWLCACFPSLQEMDLSYNKLSGPLPAHLANVTIFKEIKVEHNYLTGQIPPEYGNIPDLRVLRLEFNKLSGPLPSTFSKLDSLEDISLARNDFSGDLSVLGNTNLLICTVHGNKDLCGPIPASCRYAKGFNPWGTRLGQPC